MGSVKRMAEVTARAMGCKSESASAVAMAEMTAWLMGPSMEPDSGASLERWWSAKTTARPME